MNTSVELCGVTLKNPVMTASGTFGSGAEYSEFTDLNRLGAVVTKGVANVPWPGNPTPRVAEVYGGMLNAVGLQNPGIDLFCERDIPFLKKYDTKIIVNVCGHSTEEYVEVVKRLAEEPVDMLEINISCPNVKEGGIAFGQDPNAVEAITKEMKKYAKQPVIMKLSPNVTDITEMARAAEAGGADALSLINTITGMKIDINLHGCPLRGRKLCTAHAVGHFTKQRCFSLWRKNESLSDPWCQTASIFRFLPQSAERIWCTLCQQQPDICVTRSVILRERPHKIFLLAQVFQSKIPGSSPPLSSLKYLPALWSRFPRQYSEYPDR